MFCTRLMNCMLSITLTSIDFNIALVDRNVFIYLFREKRVVDTIDRETKHNSPCLTIVVFIDMILLIIGQLFLHFQTSEILKEDFFKSSKGIRLLKSIGIIGIAVCINIILMINTFDMEHFFYNNLLNGVLLSIVVPLTYVYLNPKISEYIKNKIFKKYKCNNEVYPA